MLVVYKTSHLYHIPSQTCFHTIVPAEIYTSSFEDSSNIQVNVTSKFQCFRDAILQKPCTSPSVKQRWQQRQISTFNLLPSHVHTYYDLSICICYRGKSLPTTTLYRMKKSCLGSHTTSQGNLVGAIFGICTMKVQRGPSHLRVFVTFRPVMDLEFTWLVLECKPSTQDRVLSCC